MQDKYPRVTQTQVDLWLVDPVTQAYRTCLNTAIENINIKLSVGSYVNPSNNDESMNMLHELLGWKQAAENFLCYESILKQANMVELSSEGEEI
jgi:hypothetical protein